MKYLNHTRCAGAAILAIALGFGCSTTDKTHQFTAVPVAQVGADELEPVSTKSPTELLRTADDAFRKANAAQERGDHKEALRQYQVMLQSLVEADLDPAVFYNLRSEFERILDSTSETTDLFERNYPAEWPTDEFGQPVVGGELFKGNPINERVIREIEEIQKLYPKNFQNGLDRSAKYMPWIDEQFRRAGLPRDLVWLAMVESQFHPSVTSRAGAVGMWQFMKATGQRYGLRVDSYVDERRDWQKSTLAAIRYLSDLRDQFDNQWNIAVSSYNMGEGGMARAIAMNGGDRDLWRLMETPPASNHMQEETKKFYPKLLASVIVARSPERYGFTRNPLPPDSVERIAIRGSYSLAALDREIGIPVGTLKKLNPELIKEVTPPSGDHMLVVPSDAAPKMVAALESLAKQPKRTVLASRSEGGATHTVRRGETLSEIARKYDVKVSDLMSANRIKTASRVPAGKRLTIPGRDASPEEQPSNVVAKSSEPAAAPAPAVETVESVTHTVKRGDTLYDIAKKYDVSVKDLQEWNKLDRHARIHVNDKLSIRAPKSAGAAPSSKGELTTHRVVAGEFPAKIADRYGVKLDDLLAWNNLSKKSVLRVGDELKIYGGKTDAPPIALASIEEDNAPQKAAETAAISAERIAPPVVSTTHKVVAGDSTSGIAQKYGVKLSDLLAWNNLSKNEVIKIGQELVINGAAAPQQEIQVAAKSDDSSSSAVAATAEHTVRSGESLWTIASKYDVPMGDLLAWNKLEKDSVLKVGQKLVIVGATAGGTPSNDPAAEPVVIAANTASATRHTVKSGESLSTIAAKYDVGVNELAENNQLTKASVLKIGQDLAIPGRTPTNKSTGGDSIKVAVNTASSETVTGAQHTVKSGESLWTIASKYKVGVDDLQSWNKLTKGSVLQVGQTLTIYGAAAKSAPGESSSKETSVKHTVQKGENPSVIASKFKVKTSDLFKWNNWSKDHVLQIGDEVTIYTK